MKGSDRRGRDVYERVLVASASLVLDLPHLIVPQNTEPGRSHRMLPHGSALQVRGEEKHLDALAPWVSQHGESWVFGQLRAVDLQGGRATKELVEILVDDEVIGELTPAMSAHFLPVIKHASRDDQSVAAKVYLKGNHLKVEAVLHAAKAHELGADWISGAPRSTAETEPVPSISEDVKAPTTQLPLTVGDDFILPSKPGRIVFNPAPGWPPAPRGWEPDPGWKPLPEWPAPPSDWPFWTLASEDDDRR